MSVVFSKTRQSTNISIIIKFTLLTMKTYTRTQIPSHAVINIWKNLYAGEYYKWNADINSHISILLAPLNIYHFLKTKRNATALTGYQFPLDKRICSY